MLTFDEGGFDDGGRDDLRRYLQRQAVTESDATVRLRQVEERDLPHLFRHQLDPAATRMAAFPARDEPAFLAHWRQLLDDGAIRKRTILYGDEVAGNIVAFDLDGERQVGYWIAPELWSRGIATRALALFLREEEARPLHAHVARHNVGSVRVLQRQGFLVVAEQTSTVRGETADELVLRLD